MDTIPEKSEKSLKFRITVEPVLFSFLFSSSLADGVVTNLILRQACWAEGFTENQCSGDNGTKPQQTASYIEVFKVLIESLLPAFLSLFVGPWSDKNGRKMLLIVPLIGYGITYICWASFSQVKDVNPYYLLFSSIGVAFGGGLCTMCMGCYCYISDITTHSNTAIRMGALEASITLGQLGGYFLSPYIFQAIDNGYLLVFIVNIAVLVINLLYLFFYLEETVDVKPDRNKNLIRFTHLKNSYHTMTEERPAYGRAIILLCCLISCLSLLPLFGELSIKYLSLIQVFKWKLKDYTLYNTILLVAVFVCSGGGIWIGKRLKIPDLILLLGALGLRVVSSILMAVSTTPTFFYVASLLTSFKSFAGPLLRSQISHIVPPNDIGKAFSFLSSAEAVVPQCASPIYGAVYAQLVSINPFAVYYVSAAFLVVAVFTTLIILFLKFKAKFRSKKGEINRNLD